MEVAAILTTVDEEELDRGMSMPENIKVRTKYRSARRMEPDASGEGGIRPSVYKGVSRLLCVGYSLKEWILLV